jgi:hypothetical protein
MTGGCRSVRARFLSPGRQARHKGRVSRKAAKLAKKTNYYLASGQCKPLPLLESKGFKKGNNLFFSRSLRLCAFA